MMKQKATAPVGAGVGAGASSSSSRKKCPVTKKIECDGECCKGDDEGLDETA